MSSKSHKKPKKTKKSEENTPQLSLPKPKPIPSLSLPSLPSQEKLIDPMDIEEPHSRRTGAEGNKQKPVMKSLSGPFQLSLNGLKDKIETEEEERKEKLKLPLPSAKVATVGEPSEVYLLVPWFSLPPGDPSSLLPRVNATVKQMLEKEDEENGKRETNEWTLEELSSNRVACLLPQGTVSVQGLEDLLMQMEQYKVRLEECQTALSTYDSHFSALAAEAEEWKEKFLALSAKKENEVKQKEQLAKEEQLKEQQSVKVKEVKEVKDVKDVTEKKPKGEERKGSYKVKRTFRSLQCRVCPCPEFRGGAEAQWICGECRHTNIKHHNAPLPFL